MLKTYLLVSCAFVSLVHGDCPSSKCSLKDSKKQPTECAVTSQDLKEMGDIAKAFQELKTEFNKWGAAKIWEQVRGKNSNENGSQQLTSVYSYFADAKSPVMAVVGGKFVSADPKKDKQDAASLDHIKKIQEALKVSKDGEVTVSYTRMEKNPADNDGPTIEAKIKAVAWDQRAFGVKDSEFFVYREIRS